MAGADSTATAVRCIFLHITTNPLIYLRLRSEILDADRRGLISSPVVRNVEALRLPYLQACIKEGLRIWPPLTGLMTKQAPPGGDTFNGVFIPGGTDIAYSAWGTHHNPKTFGEDADVYRPERWLEKKAEELQHMERSVECVFGSGRYGCLGKSVAFIELNKVFVQVRILYRLKFILVFLLIRSSCSDDSTFLLLTRSPRSRQGVMAFSSSRACL
jgi:cytochrome P450